MPFYSSQTVVGVTHLSRAEVLCGAVEHGVWTVTGPISSDRTDTPHCHLHLLKEFPKTFRDLGSNWDLIQKRILGLASVKKFNVD